MLSALVKDISFKAACGTMVHFPKGVKVYVDVDNMIAFKDGWHFDIELTEIVVLH